MRVGITGGCGFVGLHVAAELEQHGHQVTLFDVRGPLWGDRDWSVLDVTGIGRISPQTFANVDVVMHLAGVSNTRVALENPQRTMDVNVCGTANVLSAAMEAGVDRVVIAGSTLVSGAQVPIEMRYPAEAYDDDGLDPMFERYVVDEECPFLPEAPHPYVMSKIAAEMLGMSYLRSYGQHVTVLRYGIQYGPGMTPGVLFDSFIRKALKGEPLVIEGDGQQWRQYMHVSDLARAHRKVLEADPDEADGVFIVAPLQKVTVAEVADTVCAYVPGTTVTYGPARSGDIPVRMSVPMKAKIHLGWDTLVPLGVGIAETVQWYREQDPATL